jgi:hypothetical protein
MARRWCQDVTCAGDEGLATVEGVVVGVGRIDHSLGLQRRGVTATSCTTQPSSQHTGREKGVVGYGVSASRTWFCEAVAGHNVQRAHLRQEPLSVSFTAKLI